MSAPELASVPARPAQSRSGTALIATAALVLVWVAAAGVRSGTTFHLAPVLVAGAYPALRWPAMISAGARMAAIGVGSLLALAATTGLHLAGLLDGPVLVGATGFGESVLVIGVTAGLGLGAALVAPPGR